MAVVGAAAGSMMFPGYGAAATKHHSAKARLSGLARNMEMLILEPFNPVDHEGHFLNGSADALQICRRIDSPFVKINWDLYHMQLTEGNLVASMRDGLEKMARIRQSPTSWLDARTIEDEKIGR